MRIPGFSTACYRFGTCGKPGAMPQGYLLKALLPLGQVATGITITKNYS